MALSDLVGAGLVYKTAVG